MLVETEFQKVKNIRRHVVPLLLAIRLVSLTTPDSLAVAATALPEVGAHTQVAVHVPERENPLSIEEFLTATNTARAEAGFSALSLNPTLSAAAETKVKDMATLGYWDHFRPTDQKAPWDFMKDAGYSYHFAGENLARGFKTANGVTTAWLNSPAHRANLLSPNFTEVGFATTQITDDSGERVLLTVQFFGAR